MFGSFTEFKQWKEHEEKSTNMHMTYVRMTMFTTQSQVKYYIQMYIL